MKRFLSVFLCIVMCTAMFCSCDANMDTDQPDSTTSAVTTQATTAAPKTPNLLVGYGRTDITPDVSMPLHGYGNQTSRWSDGVNEPIYATCIAYTDANGTTAMTFHIDLCNCTELMTTIRRAVSKEHNVPIEQIMVSASHTHSAPSYDYSRTYELFIKEKMFEAARLAMEDRKPATIETATANPQGFNWVRYYNFSDGAFGSGGRSGTTRLSHHTEPADTQMQMVKFVREGGKDIIIENWQGHPHIDGGATGTKISSDFIGPLRDYVEQELDCLVAHFTGASGNLNSKSSIERLNTIPNYKEHGKMLGQFIVDAEFTPVNSGNLKFLQQVYKVKSTRHSGDVSIPQFVFSIGDVAFAFMPFEMFDTSGLAVKNGSPFSTTLICTCSNSRGGYFPTEYAYTADQSYEIENSSVPRGTAEIMEVEYVRLLNELYALP